MYCDENKHMVEAYYVKIWSKSNNIFFINI